MSVNVVCHLVVISMAMKWTTADECACATGNVHVRSGAGTSHSVLNVLNTGQCMAFKGHMHTINGLHWANIDYNGQDGWVAAKWLTFKDCLLPTQSSTYMQSANSSCPMIVTRSEWNARDPAGHFSHFTHIPQYVFIHHGASAPCYDQNACSAEVRAYQRYHIENHGWADIGYSFVIGEDGNVYEANGWDIVGAHTSGHNGVGIGVCIIGNFQQRAPNNKAMTALKTLIQCGVDLGKLPTNYTVQGHCDVVATSCPGRKLLEIVETWPHYHRPGNSHCVTTGR